MDPSHLRVSVDEVLSELLLCCCWLAPLLLLLLPVTVASRPIVESSSGVGEGAIEAHDTEDKSFCDQWWEDWRDSISLS